MLYINSCCCTCLAQEGLQSVHIKDADNVTLLEKVLSCLLEKDSIFDAAPMLICEKCIKHVDELYKFKKMGIKNLDIFRNCLQQIIRNPFTNLSINVTQQSSSTQETVTQPDPPEVRPEIIKIEPVIENVQPTESQEVGNKRNETESTNMDIQINNVESLSQGNQSYRNPLAKNESTHDSAKRQFLKSTICAPCGKKFIRDDYYLRHILSCTLNDTSTKNAVLRWAENRTITIKGHSIPLLNTMMDTKKQVVSVVKPKAKPKPKVKHLAKKTQILERSLCKYCKRKIATKFMKRHYLKCIFNNVRDKSPSSSSSESNDSTSNVPLQNLTM